MKTPKVKEPHGSHVVVDGRCSICHADTPRELQLPCLGTGRRLDRLEARVAKLEAKR